MERKRLAEEVDRRSEREKELEKQVVNGNKTLQTTAELVEQQKETLLQKERRISTLQNDLAKYSALEFDTKTNTGWTTSGHTGVDVEVFAFGAGYQSLI